MNGTKTRANYFWDTIYQVVEPLITECIIDLKGSNTSRSRWLGRQVEREFFQLYPRDEIFNSILLRLIDIDQARLLRYPDWIVLLETRDWARREIQLSSPVELGWLSEQSGQDINLLTNPVRSDKYLNYLLYLKYQNQLTLEDIADRTYQSLDTVHFHMKKARRIHNGF